jgi:hypothetical protein
MSDWAEFSAQTSTAPGAVVPFVRDSLNLARLGLEMERRT